MIAAMVISSDDDAYAIMARKRVRAIAGSETPTIDHYREALKQCIADKAGDWRLAREEAAEASREIDRLRLTDAELEAIRLAVRLAGDPSPITAPQLFGYAATLRGLLERLGGGA